MILEIGKLLSLNSCTESHQTIKVHKLLGSKRYILRIVVKYRIAHVMIDIKVFRMKYYTLYFFT